MAMRLNAGEVGRADYHFIDPEQIVVDEKLNGRAWPHDDESVASMAKSFEEDGGQLQPVQVRRVSDNKVQLVLGYRRYNAALLFNKLHPDKPMKLKAIVVQINDEEALRRNIVENHERKETTPVDDAFAQRRLREDYGWPDTRIAEFYRCSPPYVGILKKLLMLPTKVQRLVHGRELSVQAATALADLPPGEQAQVLASLMPGDQSVSISIATEQHTAQENPVSEQPPTPSMDAEHAALVVPMPQADAKQETLSQAVNRQVREAKVAKGGKQARSLKEVRAFFEGLTGPAEKPGVKKLAELVVKFVQGGMVDKTMTKHINALFPNAASDEPEKATESGHEPTQEPEPVQVNHDLPVVAPSESEHTAVP